MMRQTNKNIRIGFGTWPLGGNAYGHLTEENAYKTIKAAYDEGVTLFDTADIYGDGVVEKLLGAAVGGLENVEFISKVGYVCEESSSQCFDEKHIRNRIESSLKNLNRSQLDYYLLHSPTVQNLKNYSVLKIFENLKKEGLAKKIGVSLRTIDTFKNITNWDSCDSIEIILNLLDQRAIDNGLVEYCSNNNISVFARLPLCSGFLSGKYLVGVNFPKNDVRSRWSQNQIDKWCAASTQYNFLINPNRDLAQAAIAFCFCSQVNTIPIPGMKTPLQVKSNMKAGKTECFITPLEFKKIRNTWMGLKNVPPF
ncbi:MAG: aldo/keto reductase [Thermodesulfobacteriota bacterium]|nr:aldo/keto reductase [Thermodesulfobacteriota bacterium]